MIEVDMSFGDNIHAMTFMFRSYVVNLVKIKQCMGTIHTDFP